MIKPATFRGDRDGSLGNRPHLVGPRWVSAARLTPVQTGATGGLLRALMLVAVAATSGYLGAWAGIAIDGSEWPLWVDCGCRTQAR